MSANANISSQEKKIAVVGTGNVGRALGRAFARASRPVVFGARDPGSDKARAAADTGVAVKTAAEAVAEAEIVVISLPAAAVPEFIQTVNLSGRVVVDATNSIRPVDESGATAFDLLARVPDIRLVKCFNSTGFENMENPAYGDERADMFMAGDDPEAKALVRELARDAGFGECHDVGGASAAPLLEKLAVLWITLSRGELGRNFAFKIIKH